MTAAPVLFVTNHIPPDRAGAFRALHERVPLAVALFGGRSHHATAGLEDPGVPFRRVGQREIHALAAGGRYAAVVCGTAGRVALPAAFLGAQRAHVPFVLWSALWGDLTTPAHLAARPLLRHIHRRAAVVVGYGPHVTAYARRLGARTVAVAPQAVDNAFWGTPIAADGQRPFTALFVGRDVPEKGLAVLREAWRRAALADARLAVVGGAAGGGPAGGRHTDATPSSAPSRSATPTPPRTFWSYLRSPPATSSSRGGSSPTKP
jgi:glycosyltransferase involved in cell wall biosynthesis